MNNLTSFLIQLFPHWQNYLTVGGLSIVGISATAIFKYVWAVWVQYRGKQPTGNSDIALRIFDGISLLIVMLLGFYLSGQYSVQILWNDLVNVWFPAFVSSIGIYHLTKDNIGALLVSGISWVFGKGTPTLDVTSNPTTNGNAVQ